MAKHIPHTIRLQDGTYCNLNRRLRNHQVSLVTLLRSSVTDPRRKQGTRYPLAMVLLIVFVGMLSGCTDLTDACLFAHHNRKFFAQLFGSALPARVPDPTTISRVFQKLDSNELVSVGVQLLQLLGIPLGDVYSFDGKTMCAVSGEVAIRHILSLFSHDSHVAIGQVGVGSKENEIPALARLLDQGAVHNLIVGKLLIGDALHTQKATCKRILTAQADYLFVVKNNQRGLKQAIEQELAARSKQALTHYTHHDKTRGRNITTRVVSLMATAGEGLLPTLTGSNHWEGLQTIGTLHRTGTRTRKDGTVISVDELIGFISSRALAAKPVTKHLQHHWCIENNLHWVKDVVLREDSHTLRKGNAPQVMSWLRSLVISIGNGLQCKSLTNLMHNLEKNTALLEQFLRLAHVV